MKKNLFTLCLIAISLQGFSQFIATVEMKENIDGICNYKHVYALFAGFKGQVKAKCSLKKEEIQNLLNEKVTFLKANPKFKGKGMVGVFINCKGETINWDLSGNSKNNELDQQILDVFKTLTIWTPGTLDGINVDTHELISYKIKKGVLILE